MNEIECKYIWIWMLNLLNDCYDSISVYSDSLETVSQNLQNLIMINWLYLVPGYWIENSVSKLNAILQSRLCVQCLKSWWKSFLSWITNCIKYVWIVYFLNASCAKLPNNDFWINLFHLSLMQRLYIVTAISCYERSLHLTSNINALHLKKKKLFQVEKF